MSDIWFFTRTLRATYGWERKHGANYFYAVYWAIEWAWMATKVRG